jgi:transitional endoplasmic reticulum ATPase
MVDESPSDDNSVAILHPNTMEALGLFRGDTVIGELSNLILCMSLS